MPETREVAGTAVGPLSIWRDLPAVHRRWLFWNALVVAAVVNLVLNAGIAWISVASEDEVPLWAVPIFDRPSTITDTVGTFFILPLLTCLVITTLVWRELREGKLAPLPRTPATHPFLGRLPATRLKRGLALGALCTLLLGPPAVLLLLLLDLGDLSVGEFVLYKTIFGVVLGALVTPVIALLAMADAQHAAET